MLEVHLNDRKVFCRQTDHGQRTAGGIAWVEPRISEKHCGFVINTGDATAEDVRSLMKHVTEIVYAKFGVTLEPEVKFLGEF